MRKSDNLSKIKKVTTPTKKTTSKASGSSSRSAKKPSSKKSSKPSTKTSKKAAKAPAPAPAPRKRSTHHISVKARGKYIKNLYEVTKGKEGQKRLESINKEMRRIQNLVNKRIDKLEKLEAETGITAPALKKLRESGYGHGASSAWSLDYLQEAEENYKAVLDFLKDKTSTVSGTKKNMKDIEKDLHEAGWTGEHLSPEQYETFKALAEKFYSESSKYKWYMINGSRDQGEMSDRINHEIVQLLGAGDLDAALKMAEIRLDELYIQSQRAKF